ncbi:MAG TPA: aminotransferase class V-fold PLP-dependent enzyme, partial [Stellaceae bacterium]
MTGPVYGAAARGEWPLDPAIAYLNHGGFGVTPNEVLAAQAEWRARMERNPLRVMTLELPAAQRAAAATLAAYLGARGDDMVFVANATAGVNAVLRSLDFRPGDEILLTSLGYGAVAKAARYVAERSGARIVEVPIPLPLDDMAAVAAVVAARLGPRTRLAIFDHVASSSALVLPVAELTRLVRGAGARVLIDGAHAPGQVALDLPAIGADWYVGNCHKWLMAPRGCGFLWAPPESQALVHPLTISHGYGTGFLAEFDWTGTRDPTPFLAVPAAIACHQRLGGAALMARNDALARDAARLLAAAWGTETGPAEGAFAAMATVRLPLADAKAPEEGIALQRRLSDEYGIEVAVIAQAGPLWVRISAQAYNELAD